MRKFILISALLLASASAQAGENRSLSMAGIPTAPEVTKPIVAEAPKPIAQVAVRLAQAATTANDAAPVQVQAPAAPAPAPVQAQAPVQATAPAATTTTTTTPTETKTTETKPSKSAKKVRRESNEAKARRIAARYGVYW
jgi:outer membrane biosynthesis protein TonB